MKPKSPKRTVLKPCPFCENTKPLMWWSLVNENARVTCEDCGAMGPVMLTRKAAVVAWNRRPTKGKGKK